MELTIFQKKNIFLKLKEKTEWFFFGFYYPVFLMLVVNLFWHIGVGIYPAIFFCVLGGFIFAVFDDISPLFPALFCFVMSFRELSFLENIQSYFVLIPLFLGLAIHLIRFKPSIKGKKKLLFPLLFVFVSLLTGGLTVRTGENSRFMAWASYSVIGAFWVLTYVLFQPRIKIRAGFRLDLYIAFAVVMATFTAGGQLIYLFVKCVIANKFTNLLFGWGLIIQVGTLVLLALPCCFYLMVKTRKIYLYAILSIILMAIALIAKADGCTALCICFFPILIIVTYKKLPAKDQKTFCLSWIICALICVALLLVFKDWTLDILNRLLISLKNDTGRTNIYKQAIDMFLRNPIFGGGYEFRTWETTPMAWNYHSTIFHSLGTGGIVAFLAMVIYFIARIRILMSKNTDFNLYMLIAFIAFQCYAMVDTSEYNPVPLSAILLVIMMVVEKYNQAEEPFKNCDLLPLFYSKESLNLNRNLTEF